MSKPISISFGKSKASTLTSTAKVPSAKAPAYLTSRPSKPALRHDSDDEDEGPPKTESISAFAANGAVLSEPVRREEEVVIKNAGNADWRRRGKGKNLLPAEVQVQRHAETNGVVAVVERDEVSKASGLQFAEPVNMKADVHKLSLSPHATGQSAQPDKPLNEDERALQALLSGDSKKESNAVISISTNTRQQPYDETQDFREDVATRPDSCTLDEYAAMPVEEFGLAMLRGMGQKRRANGEIIKYGQDDTKTAAPKIREPRQGYLGIGARAAPGAEVELGAWGKTAMRKSMKGGEGFYTPVMVRDRRTGEMLTEDELERRKREALEKNSTKKGEEDWRSRRDRNLERDGRGKGERKLLTNSDGDEYKQQMNGFSSRQSSAGRDRERSEKSRRERNRSRSRSKERDRRRENDDERYRERKRDKYRDEERYDSSSSRKSSHRDRDRDRYDRDDDRHHRDRH